MKQINPKEIDRNAVQLIGDQWMLVTAGKKERFNTMTANWGGLGFLWVKPVAFVFVRPERYTFEFMEEHDTFTLSFMGPEYRKALNVCGSQSGRDTDKIADAGLKPLATEQGNVYFEGAEIVLECRTMYGDFFKSDQFTDDSPLMKWYGEHQGGLHKMYIAEIVNAWVK